MADFHSMAALPCPQVSADMPKPCYGSWDAAGTPPLSIPLRYVPSLIVMNVTRTLPSSADQRPYQPLILRTMNGQNETHITASWVATETKKACTATFSLTKQTLT